MKKMILLTIEIVYFLKVLTFLTFPVSVRVVLILIQKENAFRNSTFILGNLYFKFKEPTFSRARPKLQKRFFN